MRNSAHISSWRSASPSIAYWQSLTPYVYLIPASVLISLGLGLLVPDWLRLSSENASVVFLASLAVGFAAAYLIRPQRRWPLVPAAVMGLVALAELIPAVNIVPGAVQPFFVPLALRRRGIPHHRTSLGLRPA